MNESAKFMIFCAYINYIKQQNEMVLTSGGSRKNIWGPGPSSFGKLGGNNG